MNERSRPVDELQQELFEKQLRSLAKGLAYPRTPDVAGSVMTRLQAKGSAQGVLRKGDKGEGRARFISRRLAWSLTIILILSVSLMLIPPARAAIIDFIQIGVVRIFRTEPTPLAPPNQEIPVTTVPMTVTPVQTSPPLIPLLEKLAGEMTLEEAQKAVDYPILLPSYPPDLGKPERVFVQDAEGKMTILVWIDPQQPTKVLMSLHLIPAGSWAIDKFDPALVQETRVNGQRAIWAVGPYPLRLRNDDFQYTRMIDGRVLIWKKSSLTYRLETDLPLKEAIKIAESLEAAR